MQVFFLYNYNHNLRVLSKMENKDSVLTHTSNYYTTVKQIFFLRPIICKIIICTSFLGISYIKLRNSDDILNYI